MRKFRSEIYESMYEDFLDDFESGLISEAEFREFEKDCFIHEDESPRKKRMVTEHESA